MPTCKVDKQGRIVLPSKWREVVGVKPGMDLIFTEEEGRLVLKTRMQAVREAQEIVRKHGKPGVSLVEELMRDRRRGREPEDEEYKEF